MTRAGMAFAGLTAMYVGAASAAQAEFFPACSDDAGNTVDYITAQQYSRDARGQTHLVMYAGARYMDDRQATEPAIAYSPSFIDAINPTARTFVFLHECFHLKSGDARTTYLAFHGGNMNQLDVARMEYNADCSAAKRLRDEFHATEEDMMTMRPVINAVTPRRSAERFDDIMACYRAP